MQSILPSLDTQQEKMSICPELANTLVTNAKYFELKSFFGSSYDMASFFEHDDGNRYCVIHSLFGPTYKNEFESKIHESEWRISITTAEYKRQCIQDFMKENRCSMEFVYNIMEDIGYSDCESD